MSEATTLIKCFQSIVSWNHIMCKATTITHNSRIVKVFEERDWVGGHNAADPRWRLRQARFIIWKRVQEVCFVSPTKGHKSCIPMLINMLSTCGMVLEYKCFQQFAKLRCSMHSCAMRYLVKNTCTYFFLLQVMEVQLNLDWTKHDFTNFPISRTNLDSLCSLCPKEVVLNFTI